VKVVAKKGKIRTITVTRKRKMKMPDILKVVCDYCGATIPQGTTHIRSESVPHEGSSTVFFTKNGSSRHEGPSAYIGDSDFCNLDCFIAAVRKDLT
jgi:hypothetical protein